MKTLYLNNYKGFTNTFIPFLDVNFFVGENSTGKTAVLNLLDILSDMRFWFTVDFNNDTVEMGYFKEIINQRSQRKISFEIGIENGDENNESDESKYIWLKFKNKNDIPYISNYRYIQGNKTISVTLGPKKAEYRIEDYSNESFEQWIKKGFSIENDEKGIFVYPRQNLPFTLLSRMIAHHITQHSSEEISEGAPYVSTINDNLIWFNPMRAKAQRTYESYKTSFSSEGTHTPILLKKILSNSTHEPHIIIEALNKFGKSSGLYDEIEINNYGEESGSPFSINITYDKLPVRITNVGYGVSQILPIIVEIITSRSDKFAIQQPEVHLHPKAQAAFGELIYYSASENKNVFYIETHSDYTINRFRFNMFESTKNKKPSAQVLFFERTKTGTKVTPLKFNAIGQYPDNIPNSYSQFFVDEELKMLEF